MEVLELSYLTQLNSTLKNVKMATLRQREEGPRKKKLLRPYLTIQICWQHAYNSSYSGGRGKKITVWGHLQEKRARPYLTN
jgi:hypothetical protein